MLLIMKKKNYAYNESFFAEWLDSSGRTQKEVAAVLGTKNDGILRWSVGDYPKDKDGHKDKTKPRKIVAMSADNIVTLCNEYGIDLSEFFTEDGQPMEMKKLGRRRDDDKDLRKEVELLRDQLSEAHRMIDRKDGIITDLQQTNARQAAQLADADKECERQLEKQERMMQRIIDSQSERIEELKQQQKGEKENQTYIGLVADPIEDRRDD